MAGCATLFQTSCASLSDSETVFLALGLSRFHNFRLINSSWTLDLLFRGSHHKVCGLGLPFLAECECLATLQNFLQRPFNHIHSRDRPRPVSSFFYVVTFLDFGQYWLGPDFRHCQCGAGGTIWELFHILKLTRAEIWEQHNRLTFQLHFVWLVSLISLVAMFPATTLDLTHHCNKTPVGSLILYILEG